MICNFVSGLFVRAPRNSRKALVSRLALESLEAREVPASLFWTDATRNGNFYAPANWINGATDHPATQAPQAGDDVTFSGTYSQYSNDNCINLGLLSGTGGGGTNATHLAAGSSSSSGLNSLNLINGYLGTVDIVAPVQVVTFNLNAAPTGSIAQLNGSGLSDLTVTGVFTWANGILNSTPNAANVNINGGGAITLPSGGTLTTGSTLNFGNPDTSGNTYMTTTISDGGTLLFNGSNPTAADVKAGAEVVNDVVAVTGGKKSTGAANTIVLEAKSYWGYVGTGTYSEGLQFVNNGGKFFVGTTDTVPKVGSGLSAATVKMTSGTGTTPYSQKDGTLEINAGSTLDVSGSNGATVSGGLVQLTPNKALPAQQLQTSTLKGTFTLSGGSLGFAGSPVTINNKLAYVAFSVDGNVTWSGGSYVPGIEGSAGNVGLSNAWLVTGTMKIVNPQGAQNPPTIVPSLQGLPVGSQAPKGTWAIIAVTGKITGDAPAFNDMGKTGVVLQPSKDNQGNTIGYNLVHG